MLSRRVRLFLATSCWALLSLSTPAFAQQDLAARVQALEAALNAQSARIDAQQKLLSEQDALIRRQARALDPNRPVTTARDAPVATVGVAPPVSRDIVRAPVFALPQDVAVLTPKGRLVAEPQLEFSHTSANRLVFRGVEIVTGLQIGVIEASDVDRDTTSASLGLRYGLTSRLEAEIRAPYLYRSDRVTTLAQREETATRTFNLRGDGVGDVEGALRYQINSGRRGPIYIAGIRAKSNTGKGPYDVSRDEFGVATELARGSGFWGVEPSLSVLYPTDPVVLFGNISYLAHLGRDIDKTIGDVRIGKVDPGDSIGLSGGFGFAVNPRFSYSWSYKYNYILRTKSILGDTIQKSEPLQIGTLGVGASYQVAPRLRVSASVDVGATRDAPDTRFLLRVPYGF